MNASQILDATSAPQGTFETTQADLPTEPTTEQVAETKPEDPRLSLLAKMERKLKLQEQEYKQKMKELEEKQNKYKQYEEEETLWSNPLELLKKKGWDMEKLNRHVIESSSEEDLDPVSRKFKEFEETLKKKDTEYEEKMKKMIAEKEEELKAKDFERQIAEFKSDIKSFLAKNSETYELINAEENGLDIVFDVIREDIARQQQAGKETVVPMDMKDAADKVETYLDSHVQKYLNLNKYKNKKSDEENSVESFFKKSQTPQTLTDSFTPKSKSVEELSEQERMLAAVNLLKSGKF